MGRLMATFSALPRSLIMLDEDGLIDIPELQFYSPELDDLEANEILNGAQFLWLGGELDTGTYEDILENLGEIKNPRRFLDSICHFYPRQL